MSPRFSEMYDLSVLKWDSSLETSYEKIDNQHRQLFKEVNDLLEAGAAGKGKAAVMEILEFLASYVVKHFADEEQLMDDYEYSDYFYHKRIHDEFKTTAGELIQRVSTEGPTEDLINEVCAIIGAWLVNHIRGDDFRMAAFIKAADAKALSTGAE